MSYIDGFAKETGSIGEAEADNFFRKNGLFCQRPCGRDTGVDRIIKLNELAEKEARIQIKGRRQCANPRWFQLTVTSKQLTTAYNDKKDLNELWRNRINQVHFWVLVSIPLNEIWIFPSAIVLEIAIENARKYGNRKDNDFSQVYFNKYGKIEKKQKELNLDVLDASGVCLHDKYKKYKGNCSIIYNFLND